MNSVSFSLKYQWSAALIMNCFGWSSANSKLSGRSLIVLSISRQKNLFLLIFLNGCLAFQVSFFCSENEDEKLFNRIASTK